ncbi:DUF4390 domain-containing protein [Comamonadaceae bacterium OH2545_COT-014]|nr:DUF4390 domain-containing protein [Comamonadaceae bacterium OH2545_COT-014]
MDFSTRCLKNAPPEGPRRRACLQAGVALALALAAGCGPAAAANAELLALRVEQDGDGGVYLSARVRFDLAPAIEQALLKGIPLHFMAEADILRTRRYWMNARVAAEQRYWRLAYQPLTRRWRVNASSEPLDAPGRQASLAQTFDTLTEALAAVQHISHWRVAETDQIRAGARHTLRFRFLLDTSQLPRALQLGTAGQAQWRLAVERRIDLTPEASHE